MRRFLVGCNHKGTSPGITGKVYETTKKRTVGGPDIFDVTTWFHPFYSINVSIEVVKEHCKLCGEKAVFERYPKNSYYGTNDWSFVESSVKKNLLGRFWNHPCVSFVKLSGKKFIFPIIFASFSYIILMGGYYGLYEPVRKKLKKTYD